MIIVETVEQFNELLKSKPTVVDFYAEWCSPCKMFAPVFEKTAAGYPEVNFAKVDVDKLRNLAIDYQVTSVPTLIYLDKGKERSRKAGFIPQAKFEEWINAFKDA